MEIGQYKYIVVGAGWFGSVIAERISRDLDEPVLVVDRRSHTGGNCHSEIDDLTGIEYHKYGSHIFHTSIPEVKEYICYATTLNMYRHKVLTTYRNQVYFLPINLKTINEFFFRNFKPEEAHKFLSYEIMKEDPEFLNLDTFESVGIGRIGRELFNAFIREYTYKQWMVPINEIPSSVVKRLPVRYNYDTNYFYDDWQGIPINGYSKVFDWLLDHPNIEVRTGVDFFDIKSLISDDCLIVYSGPIDRYFDYCAGRLKYRNVRFEREYHDVHDYQGTSVMNYAELKYPYTRIHEPWHFHPERKNDHEKTVIFKEYSESGDCNDPYYPMGDPESKKIFAEYEKMKITEPNTIFGGRLADYKYYDMDDTIFRALQVYSQDIKHRSIP